MSQSKNLHEAKRWILTARHDLEAARSLLDNGFYPQSCFLSQQSGEKAIKALWYLFDREPWGHSIQRLVTEFPEPSVIPDRVDWIQRAAALDRYYISTRYPNGLPDLTPGENYFQQDAASAISNAGLFIENVGRIIG